MSDFFRNVGQYWADENAEFERSNPTGLQRAWRGVNPMTGFGSALGDMHTAAGQGDLGGMAMAGVQAIPGVGALRPVMPWVKGVAARRSQGNERGPYSGANPPPGYKPANERVPQGPLPGQQQRVQDPRAEQYAEAAQGMGMALQAPQTSARWSEVGGIGLNDPEAEQRRIQQLVQSGQSPLDRRFAQ